ncbi:MAG TPA: rhomboid family intramembrane serine protease [Thiobacillus sp.]|jgi:membrane associated rhomboid family serine protease|nr:rhomboid family intramembrane serine protease [Thiobacillus sp.]
MVQALLVMNGALFLLELYSGAPLIDALALWPLGLSGTAAFGLAAPHFQLWQLVTYSFLHGGIMHLLLNMYALWLFGSRMENVWGSEAFTLYYFVCVIGAGLVQLFVATLGTGEGGIYPTLGASGGVFGLLLAFGLTFPTERLMLIFPPVVLQAKWFVLIYGAIELWAGVTGTMAGVAHFAHLGGMLFGYILLLYWRRHPPGYRWNRH